MDRHDTLILRECAKKKMECASSEANLDKIGRWYRHNEMKGEPMVLGEPSGIYEELNLESGLLCRDAKAREIELEFRQDFFQYEFIGDDSVMDPFYKIKWNISESGCGVNINVKRSEDSDGKHWGMDIDYPIKDLEKDFHKLRHREYSVDREATLKRKSELEDIFGGFLPVRIHGDYWWTMGLSHHAIYLLGLENFMMYMYDQLEALHEFMRFLYDDRLAMVKWMEAEGLLNMNNENNYIGSGTRGFTHELRQEGEFVKSTDLWGLLESQPTSHVSPAMFGEFVFGHQLEMAAHFGLIYYGCCEPLHDRMDYITKIPNLKTVAVSPFSDEQIMADCIRGRYIYSRKPNPVLISLEAFDENEIIKSTKKTLEAAKGCEIEFIMKDLHTVRFRPYRLRRWAELTKQTIESF